MMNQKSIYQLLFAAGVCALSACSSADEQLPDGASSAQSVYHFQATIDSDSRTTFSEDCSRLVWTAGDRLSLFTEAGDEFVLSNRYEEESDFRAPLSSGATEVYAFYPADKIHPSPYGWESHLVYIDYLAEQVQQEAGVLNGENMPMYARATLSSGTTELEFTPLASLMAFKIYDSDGRGEKVTSVSFHTDFGAPAALAAATRAGGELKGYYQSFSQDVTVRLNVPYEVRSEKPEGKSDYIYMSVYPADFAYQNCALRVTTETRCYYFPTGMDIDFRDVYTIHPFVLNLANGQEEIIYDEEAFAPEFLQYLLETIDADQDGKISNVEVSNVEELSLADQGLTSLKGIEYFTNLKKLNCKQNQLTTLDVSACSNLRQLDCSNNQLQELNVEGCSQLATIYCNYNQLQTLDVSTCLDLYTFHCTGNQLKQLDLTRNTNLSWISCASNQIEKLELGGCSPSGISITCDENKLTKLDISMCEGDFIFIFAYSMNIPEDETFTFIKKKGQEVAILNLPKGAVTEEVDE